MHYCSFKSIIDVVVREVSKIVLGHEDDIKFIIMTILVGGHTLIYGPPGVAKTLTSEAIAHVLGLKFKRISFTPDILPSDIIGAKIIDPKTGELRTVKGPIFTNIVLADEINRGNPKSLSALLEAMQEGKVSIEGDTYILPKPFSVIATLNPVETQGVFQLPIAVLDRFTISLKYDYPDESIERELLLNDEVVLAHESLSGLKVVGGSDCLIKVSKELGNVKVSKEVVEYVMRLAKKIRSNERVIYGPSPRALQHLIRIAKGLALDDGRLYVIPDDIKKASIVTLRHRIVVKQFRSDILSNLAISEDIVADALNSVEPPL